MNSNDRCIEWSGWIEKNGYGRRKIGGRKYFVHRLVYEKTYGPIPKGMMVCHTCDNRKCINPLHLFLGTAQDNMNDMRNKNRSKYPGAPPKLTLEEVEQIRCLYSTGKYFQKDLAKQFHTCQTNISAIITGRSRITKRKKDGEDHEL